jgi:hypothetical protein
VQTVEEFEEAFIFFVDAKNFGGIVGAEFGEQDAALFAELRNAAVDGNAVRAGFVVGETLDEQGFDFGGDGVLHALGFGVRLGPRETDDFGEQNLGELVTNHEAVSEAAAFGSEKDASTTAHLDVTIAGHALESGGDGGRSDVEFFGEAGADGDLVFLKHFPNGLEVIFLRNTGFIAAQGVSDELGSCFPLLGAKASG